MRENIIVRISVSIALQFLFISFLSVLSSCRCLKKAKRENIVSPAPLKELMRKVSSTLVILFSQFEYGMGGQASTQGDVYSYGILLLEMFTGISPTNERFKDGLNLHTHVEMAFPVRVMDIIDARLFSSDQEDENRSVPENSLDCLVSVIQCGLLCSKESAKERIAMNDVVNVLNSARAKLLK